MRNKSTQEAVESKHDSSSKSDSVFIIETISRHDSFLSLILFS